MEITRLTARDHFAALRGLFDRAADYVLLETGQPTSDATVAAFFDDAPPGFGPEVNCHFGAWERDHLLGVVAMSFGYPEPSDSYIGLLIVDARTRGRGVGLKLLNHATEHARAAGATQQLVAVLEANPRGRAFWEREGFALERMFPAKGDGHIRHRLTRAL